MLRRVCLGSILALTACKPTIIEDPEPAPLVPSEPADDPLVEYEVVRAAVRDYVAALGQRDVEAASASVVGETFAYYEDLRLAALRATRAQLENWDLMSVIMILQIRAEADRARLESFDGRALFGFAVAEGMVSDDLDGITFDDVRIDETGVAAQIMFDGQPLVWLRKTDEGGQLRWRLDIPEMVRRLGPMIEAAVREQVSADGKVRTAYTLLVVSSEEPVAIEILDGPLEGEARDAAP